VSEKALLDYEEALARLRKGYTIAIDCAPGPIRPDHLIAEVIAGTGLPSQEPCSKCFGNWTWDYSQVPGIDVLWPLVKPVLGERIQALHARGKIRYGSW
jgi:hypothetical protein